MAESKKPKKKESDPLKALKFKGYCWSQSAPGENLSLDDLVTFAKFYLCKASGRLWKDPIWEEYTDEEILIEYFAHLFAKDDTARREFELTLDTTNAADEADYEWLEKMVKKNQEENQKKLEEMPEKISFVPGAEDREE